MTVHAKYDGTGALEDSDPATKHDGPIPAGAVFETTKKRFDELVKQGIPVSKVSQSEAAKLPQAGDEPVADAAQEA